MSSEAFDAQEEDRDFAELPVDAFRAEIVATLRSKRVFICIGETGSGKTTRIPQFCLLEEAACVRPGQLVGVTQPRRVGAISVATRVAAERGGTVGQEVGYVLRFDNRTSAATRIKFMTDGILVRECMVDPMLSRYDVIVLDEAHERSVHTDVLFALVKRVSARRPELRVVVTSATLDAPRFSAYFGGCPVLRVPGRVFPVDLYHSKMHQTMGANGPVTSAYVDAAAETVLKIHAAQASRHGHILVFLTGREEIDKVCRMILDALGPDRASLRLGDLLRARSREAAPPVTPAAGSVAAGGRGGERQDKMLVVPLHSTLPMEQQRLAFAKMPDFVRKCVVATNIAETSITVPHVRYVVDCGYVKQKTYDPSRRLESLVVVPVSQTAAQQRAGRAGRTGPGECYRLYSSDSYLQMSPETVPEIRRCSVGNTVLALKALGVRDVLGFDFIDPPSTQQMEEALQQLHLLGAIDDTGDVTAEGARMARLPLDPPLSRMVVEAEKSENGCVREVASIVAAVTSEGMFRLAGPGQRSRGGRRGETSRNSSSNRISGDSYQNKRARVESRFGDRPPANVGSLAVGASYDHDGNADDNEEVDAAMAHAGFAHALGDHFTFLNVMRGWDGLSLPTSAAQPTPVTSSRDSEGGARDAIAKTWCNEKFLNLKALKLADNIRSQLLSALGIGPATLVEGAAAAASSSQGGKQQQHQQEEAIARCLVAGLCDHVARRCVGGGDLLMTVPLSSPLFPHAQGPAESVAAADPESPVPVHLSPQSWLCAEKAALADRLYRNPRDSSGGRQGSGGRSEFVVYQDLVCRSSRVFVEHVSVVPGGAVREARARWRRVTSRALCGLLPTPLPPPVVILDGAKDATATPHTAASTASPSGSSSSKASAASRAPGAEVAVAGARERYLARKQQQQQPPIPRNS